MNEMQKNYWEQDTHITDEEGNDLFVIRGIEGNPDYKITLDEVKICAKYFGSAIGQIVDLYGDTEYAMGVHLSISAEAKQRGGKVECTMLEMNNVMHKWLTDEASLYLHEKMKRQVEQCEN